MHPWYLTPPAKALLLSIRARPDTHTEVRHYPLTTDRVNSYTGPKVERLRALWQSMAAPALIEATRAGTYDEYVAAFGADANDVLGALWGDPNGNAAYRTRLDDCPLWVEIREGLAARVTGEAA